MFQILVPVDNDIDRAKTQASFVASLPIAPSDVDITVIHSLHGKEREQPMDLQEPINVRSVRRAVEVLKEAGHDPTVDDVREPIVEGVVEYADDVDADLLVMGGRKRGAVQEAMFGSVVQGVIHRTERPVTVTG